MTIFLTIFLTILGMAALALMAIGGAAQDLSDESESNQGG